jgi:hypothetical protein
MSNATESIQEEETEDSLNAEDVINVLETTKTSPLPPRAKNKARSEVEHEDEDVSKTLEILQECFGVTKSGHCLRHPTCPVVLGLNKGDGSATKVMSCRVCFSEEKSVGIRQGKTFATVVQQLQRQAIPEGNESMEMSAGSAVFHNSISCPDLNTSLGSIGTLSEGMANNAATSLLLFLQQPKAMEIVMKRLSQVQNWALRQKEKEVLSLQLHIHRLEQRLAEEQKICQEQRNTVRALRRTIQQDLKIIKTMATQKQLQDEQEAAAQQKQEMANSGHVSSSASAPPSLIYSDSPAKTVTDATKSCNGTSPNKGSHYTSPSRKSRRQHPMSLRALATNMSTRTIDSSIPIPEEEEQDLEAAEAATKEERNKNKQYWNGNDLQTMKASKIFESFRGGLLDIPTSPPRARHDREDGKGPGHAPTKKKLQLNSSAMDALKLPDRALSRNSSTVAGTQGKADHEISLDQLAAQLSTLPISRQISGQSPEQFFAEKVPSHPDMPTAPSLLTDGTEKKKNVIPSGLQKAILENPSAMACLSPESRHSPSIADQKTTGGSDSVSTESYSILTLNTGLVESPKSLHEGEKNSEYRNDQMIKSDDEITFAADASIGISEAAATTSTTSTEKFVFSVTGATCQDKFGDEGTYTGTILVTEGLPHGEGKMDYESGRIYEGEWVTGQWHGRGKLLNPNGDSYDGEFFFDSRHGHGVYRWDNGDVYTGSFVSDKRHGNGKFCFHNGNVYEGEFCDGMFEGFGRYDFADGFYEGEWKEGRYHGTGELLYASGAKYTGEFRNSVAHGFGMEIMPDGRKRRGVWVDGKPTEYFDKDS